MQNERVNHFSLKSIFRWSLCCSSPRRIMKWMTFWTTFSGYFCLAKSWRMECSDTWEPMANRRLSCFSTRLRSSWSSLVVNPSAPDSDPDMAASIVETWNNLK